MNYKNKLKIFTDFDGTITKTDVWWAIGEYFIEEKIKWNDLINRFTKMDIGARECFKGEIGLIKNFNFEKFNQIIDEIEIDPFFAEFTDFCKCNEYDLIILSEGLDYYIERILNRIGRDIEFYTNHAVISEDKKNIGIEFPYSDADCDKCGTEKKNFILNMSSEDDIVVYIGDGFSDVCAVKYADVVFAKSSLASYCWKNNITYFDFQNFVDIRKKLEKITEKKIKPRQQARVYRKDAFLGG